MFEQAPAFGAVRVDGPADVVDHAEHDAPGHVRVGQVVGAALDETGATKLLHEISARETTAPDDDTRWQEALFDEAWQRLKNSDKLKPGTIEAFEAYAIRGENPEDVGKKNGMAANTVYQIKNRVLAMLKEEVQHLIAEMDPADLEQLQAGET